MVEVILTMANPLEELKGIGHGKHGKAVLWGGGILGLILVYYLYKSRQNAAASSSSGSAGGDVPALDTSGGNAYTGGIPTATGGSSGTSTDTTSTGPDLTTNVGWEEAAVSWLVGQGVSGVTAQNAVESYLNGDTLSASQGTLLDGVIKDLGIAPQGTYGIPTIAAPASAPTPTTMTSSSHSPVKAPSTGHVHTKPASHAKPHPKPAHASSTYVVKSGDNLSEIAAKHNTTWQAVYNKNKRVIGGNPNLIRPGQKLVL